MSLSPRVRAWNACLSARPGALELDVPARDVEGAVPEALRGGRLLSNGPGWNRIGGLNVHPFDGHGFVRSFLLRPDGSIHLRARFVETPSYLAEVGEGQLVHRGLATNLPGGFWRNLPGGPARNVANTTIVPWRGRLLAGWEAGAPHALHADTLDTLGEETFGGAIAGQATLAHMKREATSGRLVLCSVEMGREFRFAFREVDGAEQVVATQSVVLPGPLFTHDFALTASTYVLGGNPIRMLWGKLAKGLLGLSTIMQAIATDDAAVPLLHLVSRQSGTVRSVRLPEPGWIVHFGGAFEEEDGTVVVDACVLGAFPFGQELGYQGPQAPFDPGLPEARGPQRLLRYRIAPGATEATATRLCAHGVDFPRFHPGHEGLRTPVLFGATRADTRYSDPFDSIIRVDLEDPERPPALWTAPAGTFVGEPVFVPTGDTGAGWLLALVSDGLAERTTLVILDASDPAAGPVASVPVPLLPIAFHGDWLGPSVG